MHFEETWLRNTHFTSGLSIILCLVSLFDTHLEREDLKVSGIRYSDLLKTIRNQIKYSTKLIKFVTVICELYEFFYNRKLGCKYISY